MPPDHSYQPLTPTTWPDFECVMGCNQGGDGGCWCTWWRLPRGQWQQLGRSGRKAYFQQQVDAGHPTGIVAYNKEGTPCGWCAIAPAQAYPVIARSPIIQPTLRPGDWYVSCFFVKAGWRRSGIMHALLQHAIDYARTQSATAIEACSRDTAAGSGASDLFVGKTSIFLACGFKEIHRLRSDRPLMRLGLQQMIDSL